MVELLVRCNTCLLFPTCKNQFIEYDKEYNVINIIGVFCERCPYFIETMVDMIRPHLSIDEIDTHATKKYILGIPFIEGKTFEMSRDVFIRYFGGELFKQLQKREGIKK